MIKKMLLMVLALSCCAQPLVVAMDDAIIKKVGDEVPTTVESIIKDSDVEQMCQNVVKIGNNLYDAGKNVAKIGVQVCVKATDIGAAFTQFLAEHPKTAFVAAIAGCYGWYKWRCAKKRARDNGEDLDLVRIIEHWKQEVKRIWQ